MCRSATESTSRSRIPQITLKPLKPKIYHAGRNIHALDPYRMPSPTAVIKGSSSAEAVLQMHREQNKGERLDSMGRVHQESVKQHVLINQQEINRRGQSITCQNDAHEGSSFAELSLNNSALHSWPLFAAGAYPETVAINLWV